MQYSNRIDDFHGRPHGQQIDQWLWMNVPTRLGTQVLDYGSGTGYWLRETAKRYPQLCLTGIEPNVALRSIANSRLAKHAVPVYEDPSTLISDKRLFQSITCSQVLGHAENPAYELANMHRLLDDWGLLLIVIPNKWYARAMWLENLFNGYKNDESIRNMWTATELCRLLLDNRFDPIDLTYLGGSRFGVRESIAIVARKL